MGGGGHIPSLDLPLKGRLYSFILNLTFPLDQKELVLKSKNGKTLFSSQPKSKSSL